MKTATNQNQSPSRIPGRARRNKGQMDSKARYVLLLWGAAAILLVTVGISLTIGRYHIALLDSFKIILSKFFQIQ